MNADRGKRRPLGRAVVAISWVLTGVASAVLAAPVFAGDPFATERGIPAAPSADMLAAEGTSGICDFGPPAQSQPLRLQEAVERALCHNPKTREAWVGIKVQAAGVGVANSAYLPTFSANAQVIHDNSITNVAGQPQLSSRTSAWVRSESVSLSWVLYDFGGRDAALSNASELLAAAQANHRAVLQSTFALAAKDFYSAQATRAAFSAAVDIEKTANDSFKAASERVSKGVAPITDQLQTQTAYAQAVFNRAKAEGDRQTALGALLADLGLDPSTPITLADTANVAMPAGEFNDSVAALIDEAKRTHPSVIAAERQYQASLDKAEQVRAQGMPSLSLVAKYSANNQPASVGLGVPEYPATGHDGYFGLQVSIPLFEGFGRTYQVRQAEAQSEAQRETVDEAKLKVGSDVWASFYSLQTATENLTNSATLLDIAQRSFEAAEHRYRSGVGAILELLNAQAALATAKRQRVQALTDWRTARLQLASTLGKLGMWSIGDEARP